MSQQPKKIAIVGPESTGKSTLARQLAEALDTLWVKEYAREYLSGLSRPYVQEDLLDIARGQLQQEQKLLPTANDFLICDTNLLVIEVWATYKYGSPEPELEGLMNLRSYELHLLTEIDLPWTADPLRENPDPEERREIFGIYERKLKERNLPYVIVRGNEMQRLKQALKIIKNIG